MTPYERTIATLQGEPVDRPPIVGGFITNDRFLADASGVSLHEYWQDPERYTLDAYRAAEVDVIVQFVLPKRPEASTSGADGRSTNFSRSEKSWRERFPGTDSVIEHVRAHPDPGSIVSRFDPKAAYNRYASIMQDGMTKMSPMVWIPGHVCGCPPFQHGYTEFGYENYLCAMLEAPEAFRRYFDAWGEQRRLENIEVVRATRENNLLPLIYCGEDICYSTGPICSPELLREIYFPALFRAFEPLVENSFEIVWHSDGYIMPIIDDLLDAGVTGFQGLEEDHGMSLDTLASMTGRNGRPLIIWGSISVTSSLPFGTPEDVSADVSRCARIGQQHGARLFLAPSSSVGPEVPVENIFAYFRSGLRLATGNEESIQHSVHGTG